MFKTCLNMELIKKPFKIGNSMAVLIPKKWENEKIIVKPLKKSITKEVIEILTDNDILSEIKGLYLTGSYAREEQTENSDIDIIAITNKKHGIIRERNYEISIIPEKNLLKSISKDLYLFTSIKDAIPLINNEQLEIYKKIKQKININKLLNEIESTLIINKSMIESCEELKENIPDGTIYSLVLRLRELYLIKSLINNKKPLKKEFLSEIGSEQYNIYTSVKNNKKSKNKTNIQQANLLLKKTREWIKELRGL